MNEILSKAKKIFIIIKDSFNYTVSVKKIGLVVITLIMFFAFNDRIISFIKNFLFVKEDFSNYWLDILIIFSSLAAVFFIGFRYYKYNYLSSFTEIYLSIASSVFILFFYRKANDLNWTFHKDEIINWHYLWYLLIPLFLLLVLFIFKLIARHFIIPLNNNSDNSNEFKNDDPIFNISNDKLGYSPIVKRLTDILLKETPKKSFSIGLVGPWGNGKSSIINIVKEEIKDKTILKDKEVKEPIIIHFLPYLNHNEKDIINEFFIALSDKLSKFNGKLSDEITNYSQKLTDLYQNQNISGFIDSKISNINDEPAKDLYDNINDRLREINKKIIVFVDDLDRLNDKEILEVLKLIRNTANFHNTIFLVAMDKQYVLSRLKKNDTILNSNFVEKFFQLEVYLPEIDQSILRNYVFDVLKKCFENIEVTFESKLTSAFASNFLLFDDYVKNFRDAKRLINQIVYDYKNFGKEIDLKDFINFVFFKLKFPKFMKLLNEDPFRFFDNDLYGNLNLKQTNPQTNSTLEQVTLYTSNAHKVEEYIKKYRLYKDLNKQDETCFEKTLDIDCDDKNLLLKTLVHLFGDKNPISYNSIRKENNFRMLMQQRVFENVFLEDEFINLLTKSSKENIVRELRVLYQAKKIDQLINRIQYYNGQENNELETVIIIVLQLFENKEEFEIHDSALLNSLGRLVDIKLNNKEFKKNQELKEKNIDWIKNSIFETDDLSNIFKIRIISELWKARIDNQLWQIREEYIKETALKIYDTYLIEKKDLWSVSDYSFYSVFHDLKIISDIKDNLKKKMIEFWKDKKIELLCAQTLDIDSWSISAFNVSDFENELFGNKYKFAEFIENHQDNEKPEIVEYLEFLNLQKVTNFEKYLKFNFKQSDLIKEKIKIYSKSHLANKEKDYFDSIKQVIIEVNNAIVFRKIRDNRGNKLNIVNSYEFYDNGDKCHLFLDIQITKYDEAIVEFCKIISEILKEEPNLSKANFLKQNIEKKENFIELPNEDFYIKIISSY